MKIPCLKGWRAEVGILTPTAGHERELEEVAPQGVRFVRGLLGYTELTHEGLKEMTNQIESEAIKINMAYKRDIICFACTSGSLIGGPGYDKEIIERIERASGSLATTTVTCVVELFKDMGIRKVVIVGPYTDDIFEAEVTFLEACEIEAIYMKGAGLGLTKPQEFWEYAMNPYGSYKLVKDGAKAVPGADCVFLTCTASPLLGVADILENEIGKPVISSLSATLYGILKKLGIPDSIYHYGVALTKPRLPRDHLDSLQGEVSSEFREMPGRFIKT
jgi:maleate isomerase